MFNCQEKLGELQLQLGDIRYEILIKSQVYHQLICFLQFSINLSFDVKYACLSVEKYPPVIKCDHEKSTIFRQMSHENINFVWEFPSLPCSCVPADISSSLFRVASHFVNGLYPTIHGICPTIPSHNPFHISIWSCWDIFLIIHLIGISHWPILLNNVGIAIKKQSP